jgi:hypothetical protein
MVLQAISPLLRGISRSAPPAPTPNGDLTDRFVPSDGRAPPSEQSDADRRSALGKVTDMYAKRHDRAGRRAARRTGRERRSADS